MLNVKTYLVGGAVRDRLLGLPVKDRDFVVVGASPEHMLAAGFKAVGADFPVFLHPQTAEEYALARTERKSGRGYQGFSFHAAPEVTLEQDLARRDLTINAIAEGPEGELIDPYGGLADLESRVLRHVSPAFSEDPLRVLRVARFAARFAPLAFRIAPETMRLMQALSASGELAHLTAERVWAELKRALLEARPSVFLRTLRQCGALKALLPELDALYGVPQRVEFHPEIDTGLHQEMVSDAITELAPGDELSAWCALVHDLGKGLTPDDILPKHLEHETRGVEPVRALGARLKVPREHLELAALICRDHLRLHMLEEARAGSILKLIEGMDGYRKPDRLRVFALVCQADKRGRLGQRGSDYPSGRLLRGAQAASASVDTAALLAQGHHGEALGRAIRESRLQAIAKFVRSWRHGTDLPT